MKKIIALVVCLLITASVFAFDTGTKIIGASVSYESYKQYEDIDAVNTFALDSHVGYFLMPDISLDIILWWQSVSGPNPYITTVTQKTNDILFGVGGSYYFGNIYGSAAILYELYSSKSETKSDETWTENGMFLGFGVGYLLPVVENVFVDIGASYLMGLGKYSGDSEADNKETDLTIGAGLVIAIP